MMKHILAILIVINLGLQMAIGGMLLLTNTYPFAPGDGLYDLQFSAEQARLRLSSSPARQADFALALAERRLAELARAENPAQVEARGATFARSLDQAIAYLADLPQANRPAQQEKLGRLTAQADTVLAALAYTIPGELASDLNAQIARALDTHSGAAPHPGPAAIAKVPATVPAKVVPFLGEAVEHASFPLESGHAGLACQACHPDGAYAGTPATCNTCHALPAPEPALAAYGRNFPETQPSYPGHFPGECSDCHGLADWEPTAFDHATVVECASCHASDTPKIASAPAAPQGVFVAYQPAVTFVLDGPAEHYPGECQLCHTDTLDWGTAAFEHAGVAECASCHANQAPAQHLPGTCANCHSDVEDWANAQVNHTGYADCLSCHLEDDPAGHYAGRCSNCHGTQDWELASFNHTGFDDCRTCHQKPGKHYTGQCSSCHSEAMWEDTDFSHSEKYYDCQGCHLQKEPSQHYTTRCTDCHSTNQWAGASFEHTGGLDCQQCHRAANDHYLGQCSRCHNTFNWANAEMDHSGYDECFDCHTAPAGHWGGACSTCHSTQSWDEGVFAHEPDSTCSACHPSPMDHYLGECSACHAVNAWLPATFNHTGFTDCLACHAAPAGHWPGQCSNCHFIIGWEEIVFDHTGYTSCNSCHPRPASHTQRGQCSKCHTTETWIIPTATPLVGPRDISDAIPIATPTPENEAAAKTPAPPSSRATPVPTETAAGTSQPPSSR